MNLYDEAIEDLDYYEHYGEIDLPLQRKALERAKKVEELLELKTNYILGLEQWCSIRGCYYPLDLALLDSQIKALEEELK